MIDRFGVPETMFGPVPDEFYALVGRIALVSTLLEDRMLGLLWAVDDQPQPTHAGRPAGQIKTEIEARLATRRSNLGDDLVTEVEQLLADISDALDRRHALIHSLWPNPTEDHAQGWRSRRLHRSLGGGSEIVWTQTSVAMLRTDLARLVDLVDAAQRTASRLHGRSRR